MTRKQLAAHGIVIEQYVPGGADAETRRNPWLVRRLGTDDGAVTIPQRFPTRAAAIKEVEFELSSPDSLFYAG